jgi:N-acetylglucosaminyl-diphospho-decaprenol L-rhamnosyltransferase
MRDLAVIIVTWNVRELALDALRSLYADLDTSGLDATVYVVDSASSDSTVEAIAAEFPQAELIASAENLGFAGGNNCALRRIGFGPDATASPDELPRAVYLLNPDTITQPGATRALYDALLADPMRGLVGARLEYGDGRFQHGAFAFPGLRQLWIELFPAPARLYDSPFNGRYPRRLYEAGQPFPVDFTLGATMMLRREVIQQTGMFDEAYFMYGEEIDWAWRIHRAGWSVYCVPAAEVIHLSGQSTAQARPRSVVNLWTSRLLLFRRYYPGWKLTLARWMIRAGMRRKVRQVRAQAGLSPDERSALIDAYEQVAEMAAS